MSEEPCDAPPVVVSCMIGAISLSPDPVAVRSSQVRFAPDPGALRPSSVAQSLSFNHLAGRPMGRGTSTLLTLMKFVGGCGSTFSSTTWYSSPATRGRGFCSKVISSRRDCGEFGFRPGVKWVRASRVPSRTGRCLSEPSSGSTVMRILPPVPAEYPEPVGQYRRIFCSGPETTARNRRDAILSMPPSIPMGTLYRVDMVNTPGP